jgi:glycosyltransferase involved in cell wall biosynthesis
LRDHRTIGGAERRFLSVVKYSREMGIEFLELAFRESHLPEDSLPCPTYLVSRHVTLKTVIWAIQGMLIARRHRCDGVYAYTDNSRHVVLPSFLVSLFTRKPLFVVVHDDGRKFEDLMPVSSYLKNAVKSKKPPIIGPVASTLSSALRKWICEYHAVCLCGSVLARRYALEVLRARRCQLTGNGVDSEWFSTGESQKQYTASFAGRIEKLKGIDTLLYAWKRVVAKYPEAKLVLVGPIKETKWNGLVSDLGISGNVILHGFVTDSEERRILASSKLFVFPSRHEGFGLAVAEAMAIGVPCVISDHPALVENFSSAAVIFPNNQEQLLASAILDLLDQPSKMQAMIEAGRKLVSSMRWENVCTLEASAITQAVRS